MYTNQIFASIGIPMHLREVGIDDYAVPRGHHPNARGGFTTTSNLAMMQFKSRSFSEKAYEKAAEPKELYIVPDAEHIDLYDQVNKIPFDKLENFFKDSLE